MTWPSLALHDPRVVHAMRRWGAPYGWGKGSPATADDPGTDRDPGDCSGDAQEILVEAGELASTEPDRNASGLAYICDPVSRGQEQPFDLAFYGSGGVTHVMVVVGPSAVLGASGGGSKTHGDDPRAFVQLHRIDYRSDLIVIGRLKAAYRVKVDAG